MFGIPSFDHFGHACVTIFQVLTLESWSYLMYNYTDSSGPITTVIFFVFIVILGSFFTMNLFLAMIMDKFQEHQVNKQNDIIDQQEEEERERKHEQKLKEEKRKKTEEAAMKKLGKTNSDLKLAALDQPEQAQE
jgi:hypothetical protein